MPVGSIHLHDFTAFHRAEVDLCDGVNVLMGPNATGKTHLMKALYAMARAGTEAEEANRPFFQKLVGVFKPDGGRIERLLRRGTRKAGVTVTLRDGGYVRFVFPGRSRTTSSQAEWSGFAGPPSVFIPSREGLAMYEGFVAAYQKRELSFDETYHDLAVSLSAGALRGPVPAPLRTVVSSLETVVGGKVVLDGARFYLRAAGGSMLEAHLVSEGMRKLASILRLLQNGELRQTGLLLWDEPEANLNPKLVVVVARILADLAANDVQVVVATHDYLLVETLSWLARQSGKPSRLRIRFFTFERSGDGSSVEVSHADELAGLSVNRIREEYLAHYDRLRGVAD